MRTPVPALLLLCCALASPAQIDGDAAWEKFLNWRKTPEIAALNWEAAIARYTDRLRAEGLSETDAASTISIVTARDEGVFYDSIFAKPAKFSTNPNALLAEAVRNRRPGKALDVGMGQGRNAVFLARQGWDVTGFDVSRVALDQAQQQAASAGTKIKTLLTSAQEFDFGENRWDLVAILYPIEKYSVYRVRDALKPGGIVVVECSHKEASNATYEYDTNELLKIFDGFRILKYEDKVDTHDWAQKPLRLVRLIAQKER